MCKCKLYNAAILFVGFLVGIGAAIMAYFGLFPGLCVGLTYGICISVSVLLVLVLGMFLGCRCMKMDRDRCKKSAMMFAMEMAILSLLAGLLAICLYGYLCLFTSIVVGVGTMFFVAMLGSLAVLVKGMVHESDCDC